MPKLIKRKRNTRTRDTFLGYTVFHLGEPFMCSGNTVTRNRLYLMAHALEKLNRIDAITCGDRHDCSITIKRLWRNDPSLTLRRVYAKT